MESNNKVVVISDVDFVVSLYDNDFKITITNKKKSNKDIATEIQKIIDELQEFNALLFLNKLEKVHDKN